MISSGQSFLLSHPFTQMNLKFSWRPYFHLDHHGSLYFFFLLLMDQTQSLLHLLPSHAQIHNLSPLSNQSRTSSFLQWLKSYIGSIQPCARPLLLLMDHEPFLLLWGHVQTSPNHLSPLSHTISYLPPLFHVDKEKLQPPLLFYTSVAFSFSPYKNISTSQYSYINFPSLLHHNSSLMFPSQLYWSAWKGITLLMAGHFIKLHHASLLMQK